ncbi:hypothetical protein B0O99DRAFT_521731 [Bisporella sp. PMI_857]|nr:hypothetical protein B0O99DRAFT_521731 [Bisporella sp. PMI_857]
MYDAVGTDIPIAGNGEPATEKTKSCQLNLSLQLPDGVQYTVVDVGTRGYVGLDAGVTATQANTYSLAGGSPSITKQSTFAGPVDSSYTRSDSISLDTAVWSACGGTSDLNIIAEVAVEGSSETALGSIAADSIDGRFGATIALAWRKC